MMRVLLNFTTSNGGGVVGFKQNILKNLSGMDGLFGCNIFVLYSGNDFEGFDFPSGVQGIRYVGPIEGFLNKIRFYETELDKILRRFQIDCLVNFGDIPARSDVRQVFYFDWPYAVYNDYSLWFGMRFSDFWKKLLKRLYFRMVLGRPERFIVQTRTMENRLSRSVPGSKISVIDVGFDPGEALESVSLDRSKEPKRFVYPTAVYPHKNVDILIEVAAILASEGIECVFVLTFDGTEGRAEKKIVQEVKDRGLSRYFEFCGRLSRPQLIEKIRASEAIVMPTLIETYGLPYLEAKVWGKAMLTSDRDFARELCGEAALYFDPLDSKDIAKVLTNFLSSSSLASSLGLKATEQLKSRTTWAECVRGIFVEATSVR